MDYHRWTNLWAVGLLAATVLLTLGALSPARVRRMYAQVDGTATVVVYLPQIQNAAQNTETPVETPTAAMTPTGTVTPIQTTTATASSTPTHTATGTATPTHTATVTGTSTPTATATATPTQSATPFPTTTATGTSTPTATATATPTQSATPIPPVRMAVIGDFGMNNSAEADVANLVASWHPDAVVTTGDNNYPAGAAETLDANVGQFYHAFISPYLGIYGAGAANNRFFPVLGNHDWGTATGTPPLPYPHLTYFDLPGGPGQERYYDVVLGPLHIFALDSDACEPDGITSTSVQADWLRTGLAASTAPWKLVFLHHPPFSSSSVHGSTPALQWPFGAWGATAVLAGHDHTYERLVQDGLPYFVNGIGGAALYALGTPLPGSQVRFNGDHGAMLIEATAESITFQLFDRTGVVRDTYTLAPPPPPPAWQIVERRVASSADDAEERNSDGAVNLTSTDLELTVDPGDGISQTVGVRFVAVTLPVEATIIRAYIEFTVDEVGSDGAALQVAGERAPAPAVFAATPGNLTGRSRTGATVAWEPVSAWPAVGARQRTPNLAAIVQEQIGQPGWAPGNALAFLITGEGQRTAEAYDGVTWAAPLLHVEYALPASHLFVGQPPDATALSR